MQGLDLNLNVERADTFGLYEWLCASGGWYWELAVIRSEILLCQRGSSGSFFAQKLNEDPDQAVELLEKNLCLKELETMLKCDSSEVPYQYTIEFALANFRLSDSRSRLELYFQSTNAKSYFETILQLCRQSLQIENRIDFDFYENLEAIQIPINLKESRLGAKIAGLAPRPPIVMPIYLKQSKRQGNTVNAKKMRARELRGKKGSKAAWGSQRSKPRPNWYENVGTSHAKSGKMSSELFYRTINFICGVENERDSDKLSKLVEPDSVWRVLQALQSFVNSNSREEWFRN